MALCYTYIRRRTMQNPGLSFREPEDGIVFLTGKALLLLCRLARHPLFSGWGDIFLSDARGIVGS